MGTATLVPRLLVSILVGTVHGRNLVLFSGSFRSETGTFLAWLTETR